MYIMYHVVSSVFETISKSLVYLHDAKLTFTWSKYHNHNVFRSVPKNADLKENFSLKKLKSHITSLSSKSRASLGHAIRCLQIN